jgi:hypothetical protein
MKIEYRYLFIKKLFSKYWAISCILDLYVPSNRW